MYLEVSFTLFALGLVGLVSKPRLNKLLGFGIFVTSPNVLVVYSGARSLLAILLPVQTILIITLVILYVLREKTMLYMEGGVND